RAGANAGPLKVIRIGAFDYYSGLKPDSLSVKADFAVNGKPPGTELAGQLEEVARHVRELKIDPPIVALAAGKVTVTVSDQRGNGAGCGAPPPGPRAGGGPRSPGAAAPPPGAPPPGRAPPSPGPRAPAPNARANSRTRRSRSDFACAARPRSQHRAASTPRRA